MKNNDDSHSITVLLLEENSCVSSLNNWWPDKICSALLLDFYGCQAFRFKLLIALATLCTW